MALNLKEFDSKIEYVLFKSEYLQLVEGLIHSSSLKIVLNIGSDMQIICVVNLN